MRAERKADVRFCVVFALLAVSRKDESAEDFDDDVPVGEGAHAGGVAI
jgi:hypothetical protein